MNLTFQSDAMRELIRRMEAAGLTEADENTPAEPSADANIPAAEEPADAAATDDAETQAQTDADIEKVMTEPRGETPAKITVSSLAGDLGIENTDLFKTAFNTLRSGAEPTDPMQIQELAAAFTKIMSTDTSTAQHVVNRLRKIYRKPLPGAQPSA